MYTKMMDCQVCAHYVKTTVQYEVLTLSSTPMQKFIILHIPLLNPKIPCNILNSTLIPKSLQKVHFFETKKKALKRLCIQKDVEAFSMAEPLNIFQGLIYHVVYLDKPLANEVVTLLLLGSLPNNQETLVVTLGDSIPQGIQSLFSLPK